MEPTPQMVPAARYLSPNLVPLDFFTEGFDARGEHIENLLCRYLNTGAVIAFIGAGTSQPLGYPGWPEFARDIITILNIRFDRGGNLKKDSIYTVLENFFQTIPDSEMNNQKKTRKRDLYSGVLHRLYESDLILEVEKARRIYNDENKKTDDKSFEDFLKYLDRDVESELDPLFIFSECERLLSSKEDWGGKKQSHVFREIISSYFGHIQEQASLNKENLKLRTFNPYIALQQLPIKKFITFNYDLEIERALLHEGRVNDGSGDEIYGDEATNKTIEQFDQKSFSQKREDCEKLARFSVARFEETEYSVFHCHGRIDDVNSCIVSEEDYQKWYLREDVEHFKPFRQTLNLALESNPILFIGFGLKDADLMRLLRQITANRSVNRTRTPLFCLLYVLKDDIGSGKKSKWKSENEFREECTALYMKYGLHIIPVMEKNEGEEGRGSEVCEKLLELRETWRKWWQGILLKPQFRRSPIKAGLAETTKCANGVRELTEYFHYKFILEGIIDKVDEPFVRQLHHVLETAPDKKEEEEEAIEKAEAIKKEETEPGHLRLEDPFFAKRLAIVMGDGGTGKSWAIQKYLRDNREGIYRDFKIFFWSAYYSNDVTTGIDRLMEFFNVHPIDPLTGVPKDKFRILREIIDDETDKIIVFDGIEKLLIPNEENTEGISISPEIREFFKILSHTNNKKSRIILASRIFPIDILYHFDSRIDREEKGDSKKILEDQKLIVRNTNVIFAPKCFERDLQPDQNTAPRVPANEPTIFPELDVGKASSICSLVEGHVFGISLIRGILNTYPGTKTDDEFNRRVGALIQHIADTPVDRRLQSVIEKAIQSLDEKYDSGNKLVEKLVERMALLMHPIREEVARVCFQNVTGNWPGFAGYLEKKAITEEKLLSDLLYDLVARSIIQKVEVTTGESDSEEYVFHTLIRSYVFERLHKCLFVSLPSLQLPGFSSGKEIVDPGNDRGKKCAIEIFNTLCEKVESGEHTGEVGADMCRAAFSILRSRFCSNTVARWGSYDEYLKLTVRLYDTAKRISPKLWDYKEPTNAGFEDFCESKSYAPLYPDEMAWVYNEIGLVSNSMGNILNSTALWEQGHEINKLIDRYKEGRYLFQSHFNLGAVNLYYGKLRVAQTHLDKAYEISNSLKNENLSNRVLGTSALLKYLQGNLEEADADFASACENLDNNPRARSFLYCLHGELAIKRQELTKAKDLLERSRHLAEAKYYPDLIAYARLGKANLLLHQEQYSEAQHEFQVALRTAKAKCLFRLESATLSGLSRLAEKIGDYQLARDRAIDALKISNEYSLGLHQTVSLLVLGKALVNSELRDFGIAYLRTARDLAKLQGYFLRLTEAEQELRKHNALEDSV